MLNRQKLQTFIPLKYARYTVFMTGGVLSFFVASISRS